jgi:hypothetical protein
MGKSRFIIATLLLISILYSCTDSNTDKPLKNNDSLSKDTVQKAPVKDTVIIKDEQVKVYPLSKEDKVVLDLLQSIEMGFSFMKIKEKYDMVKGIRPEDKKDELANAGYTESLCKQPLFGGIASAEFHFKNDSLYAYSFTFNDKDSEKAEQVFQAVKKYYSGKWGQAQIEEIEEENHYNQTYVWPATAIVPYVNYNINTNTIIWGKRIDKVL